jgi:hypothetical protein
MASLMSMLLLFILVVLPLIPAVVIYALFPNTTVVASGPLSGLTLKSSGAFSVYIVVFLVMAPFAYQTAIEIANMSHPSWTIMGKIILKGNDGKNIADPTTMKNLQVTLSPNIIQMGGGTFTVSVPELDGRVPNFTFSVGDLGSTGFNVDDPGDAQIDRSDMHKTINIRTPVIVRLSGTGAYDAGLAPLQAAGPAPANLADPKP